MSAETSKNKLKRRASKRGEDGEYKYDSGHQRELEQKRNRGETFLDQRRRIVPQSHHCVIPVSCPYRRGERSTEALATCQSIYLIHLGQLCGVSQVCDHRTSCCLNYIHLLRLKIKCDKQIPCQSCQVRPFCATVGGHISSSSLSSDVDVQHCVQMVCVMKPVDHGY
jgi:hypothetical protein